MLRNWRVSCFAQMWSPSEVTALIGAAIELHYDMEQSNEVDSGLLYKVATQLEEAWKPSVDGTKATYLWSEPAIPVPERCVTED